MILLLALSVSCGESSQKTGNPTLDNILLDQQTLLQCEGSSDAPLTTDQINALVQDCTPAKLQAVEKFAACF